ncbi:MAG: FAD-binding oxidoreductase [Rhodobacteraceae bacterium]|nr:FAD-binding oxidoreductase [Paracoccaceae bacterium]
MTNANQVFSRIVGKDHVLSGERLSGRNPGYCTESLNAELLLRPGNVGELSAICKTARERGISLVPHGGLTGLVDGTASQLGQAIISFERMNHVLRIDPGQGVAVVEPGVTLEALSTALEPYRMICGVEIPSRGSCTIGGMASTNAGGTRVLKYGMMRQNILGLEVVLADGRILDMTSPLIKNNAGYDLKQMFIGSEGTLGLISKIVVKLWPAPEGSSCALLACKNADQLPGLFAGARKELGTELSSFEAMWPEYYRKITTQPGYGTPPLAQGHGIYAVVELSGKCDSAAQETLIAFMEPLFERGLLADAIVAQSEAERATIWQIREDTEAIESGFEACLSYDVGLELDDLNPYVEKLTSHLSRRFPQVSTFLFGHVGDGNLHVMLGLSADEFAAREAIDDLLYDAVSEFKGSTVSAEHGIGLEKRAYLNRSVSPEALEIMRELKTMLDPLNVLNPGKILVV